MDAGGGIGQLLIVEVEGCGMIRVKVTAGHSGITGGIQLIAHDRSCGNSVRSAVTQTELHRSLDLSAARCVKEVDGQVT